MWFLSAIQSMVSATSVAWPGWVFIGGQYITVLLKIWGCLWRKKEGIDKYPIYYII